MNVGRDACEGKRRPGVAECSVICLVALAAGVSGCSRKAPSALASALVGTWHARQEPVEFIPGGLESIVIFAADRRCFVVLVGRGEPPGGVADEGTYVLKGIRVTTMPAWLLMPASVAVSGNDLTFTYDDGKEARYRRLRPWDPTTAGAGKAR